MIKWPQVQAQITSNWSSHIPSWIIFTSIWCLNSTLLLGLGIQSSGESEGQLRASALANLIAGLCVLSLIAIWKILQTKLPNKIYIKLFATLALGSLAGLTKGVVTYSIFWHQIGVGITSAELVKSSLPAVLIGFFTIAIFGIVGSISQEFFNQRDLLVSERVSQRVAEEVPWPIDSEVQNFIDNARIQLARVDESSSEMKKVLIELAQLGVRPISHQLWQEEKKYGTKFAFRYLFNNTIRNHQFPEAILAISTFLLIFPQQVSYVGFTAGFIQSIIQCLAIYITFKVGRNIPRVDLISGLIIFLTTPLVAVIAIDTLTTSLFEPISEINRTGINLVLYFGLLISALLLSMVLNAPKTIADLNFQLTKFESGTINFDAEKVIKLIRKRETAELLHGYVQNQLMTAALRVDENENTNRLIRNLVSDLLTSLENGTLQVTQTKPVNLQQVINSLEEIWRGVVTVRVTKVDLTNFDQEKLSDSQLRLLDRLINELIGNAHRHGLATEVEIQLYLENQDLVLAAKDNGVGPRQGEPGLGTALLNAATAGRWTIQLDQSQMGSIVKCKLSTN